MRLGVVGWPIGHSLSPAFQNAGLRAAGLSDWRYQRLAVPPELLTDTLAALPAAGFRGVNVTIPHKRAALSLAGSASRRAQQIGAANTLVFEAGGETVADNTDAPGLITALPEPVTERTALVLGAGGTARAAVWALFDAGASEVLVWNRDPERARRLCMDLGGAPVQGAAPADLLVNCTAHGLQGESSLEGLPVDEAALGGFGVVVDFVYRDSVTPLIGAARRGGVATVDGLELLLAQGALSFEQFTGRPAPRVEMRAALPRA